MTTYAPTFTPRYRLKYKAAGIEHTIQARGPRGTTLAGMQTIGHLFSTVFNNLSPQLADDFAYIQADVALTDDEVFNPATLPDPVTGAVAVADFSLLQRVTASTFSGRAPGSKARFSLYGVQWVFAETTEDANDFVVTGVESAGVLGVVTAVNNIFCAGSGVPAAFYNRATIKANDDLIKKVRRGIIS
jgi:hypothetical protein